MRWTVSIVYSCFAIDNLLDGDEVWIGLTKMLEKTMNDWIMIDVWRLSITLLALVVLMTNNYIVCWMLLKSFELVWFGLMMFKTNEFFFVKKDFTNGIYEWEIKWMMSIGNSCFAIDNLFANGNEVWIGLTKMLKKRWMIESRSMFKDYRLYWWHWWCW